MEDQVGWQDIARVVAPTLATALGGPLAGVAASVAAQALLGSTPEAAAKVTPAQIIDKIGSIADPGDMAKLKQAELDVQKFEADNSFRFSQLAEQDRQGARVMRQTALASGNETADRLSWLVMVSFLAVAGVVVIGCGLILKGTVKVDPTNSQVWIAISGLVGGIVGYFSANANQVVGFYFGSSASSAAKSDQMASNTATAIDAIVQNQAKPSVVKTEAGGTTVTTATGEPAADKLVASASGSGTGGAAQTGGAKPPAPLPASARFDACVTYVLEREGGFVQDHNDRGGPTNLGITQATLESWRHAAVTTDEVEALTPEEAKAIYHANYWNAARCDALPPGVDLSVFDAGVMSGPGQAVKFLQHASGLQGTEVDGAVGQQTLTAVTSATASRLIDEIAAQREIFYGEIVAKAPDQGPFLAGWKNRAGLTRTRAQSMCRLWV
jgi:lysozyme family protein